MFLVRCPTSIQGPYKHPRTIPAEFLIFSRTKKNVFLGGLQTIKIPIVETGFMQKCTNSIRGFEPFGFNDRMHVPNTCQSVFPHDHCSSLFWHFSLSFPHLVARVQNLQQIRFHKAGNRDSVPQFSI